jgi:hypothetical protein
MFCFKRIFVFITNQVDWRHVYFIESSQHGCFILAASNLSLRRNIDNFVRSVPREPPVGFHRRRIYSILLMILPALPVPVRMLAIFFSSNIFLAAGDGFLKRKLLLELLGAAFGPGFLGSTVL